MKKFLLLSIIAVGLLSFTTTKEVKHNSVKNSIIVSHNDPLDCTYGQCQAIAKSTGKQCKHCVSNSGDLYCWQHK